jgi:lipid-A-disaccharide synthase
LLIYLVAGEASGDVLGARLMLAIRRLRPDATFAGVGGPRMAEQGFSTLFPMNELAVMGLVEVLPRLMKLRRRIAETVADVASRRPAVVVTIDSPSFTLRVLRGAAPLGIPRAHYVAPQVWGWREGRAREFPALMNRLLCLLPFEPAFFARHGVAATFVGHPVLESGAGSGNARRFRERHAISPEARVLTVMPGSRRSETDRLLPVFREALDRLSARVPHLRAVMPVAAGVADAVRAATADWPTNPVIVTELSDKHDAYAASDAALTKSGTSTLELAMAGVPMAVAYRVNPLTASIVRRLVRVKYASILNLIPDRLVVPELIQENCTPPRIADALERLLKDGGAAQTQRAAFATVLEQLRPAAGLPSDAAAEATLELVERGGAG